MKSSTRTSRCSCGRSTVCREDVLEFGLFLARTAQLVEIDGTPQGCRDPSDDVFLETARKGQAEYLVTFDRDLLETDLVSRLAADAIKVVSIAAFLHDLRTRGVIVADTVVPRALESW